MSGLEECGCGVITTIVTIINAGEYG